MKDEGILRHTDFERISARANINHTVNKFIDINGNLAYARAEKNAGQSQNASLSNYSNAFMFTQQIAPIYPVYAYDETEIAYMTKKATLFMILVMVHTVHVWAVSVIKMLQLILGWMCIRL